MGAKVTEEGISSIVKERIDNFEYNPDSEHRRGENSLVIHIDDCAFINDDKSRMYIVNDYKDGLVYVNHHLDFPLGSIVEFRDAKDLKGVLSGYEDGRSIITMLGYEAELSKGKPFWVTNTILSTPDTKPLHNTTTVIEPRFNQDGTILSFGEHQVPTFNNEVEAICNDIRSHDNLFFICPSCGYVRKTKPLIQEYNGILLEKLIENKNLVCECCIHGTTDDEHVKPTEDEMIIASFSTYNFISKFDQSVPEIVEEDNTQPHGVKLGTILSFDDVNIKESSTKISESLKELMKSLKDKMSDKLGNKVNNKKLNDMIEKPNQTMLKIELAEMKRKLKLAKKFNNKEDIEHFQKLYNKTKEQLVITHD